MSRRIEGSRLDVSSVDAVSPHARTGAPRGQQVERRRFDAVEQKTNHAGGSREAWGIESGALLFEPGPSGTSINDVLVQYVRPRVPDPAILRRATSILEDCISELLPRLGGGEQLRSMAETLMRDEIDRHLEILEKLHGRTDI
ncbi:hypothetical protein KEU06_00870 [Pseudaminobacter sp. 19-2017]|uniref:Uncharacterized protein n=1 Tax=Pseudaminobacter soli (ex Zhang et al. 2022) TaxID=2831468 RepID=A0A942I167_9HYPH|nr:hypothetical protein [Pseudaminobacter soli]MBS3647177.1 hypothetical protein [Pseudaminobacter soli]